MNQADFVPRTREQAAEADRLDPLAGFRDDFVFRPDGPVYLDGNSLGRQPRATANAVAAFLDEWGRDLVAGWDRWANLPQAIGDRIGGLVGASPGQVVVSDSTTVNLYKLAVAAVDARQDRRVIVGDANDFPTVRYVLQGLAARQDCRVRLIESDPAEGVDAGRLAGAIRDDVSLVCLSAVNYRSGAVVDMPTVNRSAQGAGALTLWDLSHAAGVIPVDLDAAGTDLAVGCGYKYLNGGPGAPAWLYVRAGLQPALRQPIWGWWGQADQFAMGSAYDPVPTIGRFLPGTPAVLGMVALDAGVAPLVSAGIPALWDKTRRLVELLAWRVNELLTPLGAGVASPVNPARRGGHLAVAHSGARAAASALVEKDLVVPDFRPPDVMRLAPVALYTGYVEVWDAVERIAEVLGDPAVHTDAGRQRATRVKPE
jgi:kynureninase